MNTTTTTTTTRDKIDKLTADTVADIGEIFSNVALINKRSEIELIVLRAFSKLILITREMLNNQENTEKHDK